MKANAGEAVADASADAARDTGAEIVLDSRGGRN